MMVMVVLTKDTSHYCNCMVWWYWYLILILGGTAMIGLLESTNYRPVPNDEPQLIRPSFVELSATVQLSR